MSDYGFCFLDVETTGLDPVAEQILEVGILIVSHDLETVISSYSYLCALEKEYDQIDKFVLDMHDTSGLWESLQQVDPPHQGIVQLNIEDDIMYHKDGQGWKNIHLAGNSVHFDRSFLKVHMPRVEAIFHHRHLDCSSLKMLAGTVGKELVASNEVAHRAINDCYESLSLARQAQEWVR